ncbi:hypothetical protein IX324_000610 [Bacteroides pyogenes]|nr:hypothetical protein [Bacteroides pyogenes]
MRLQQFNLNKLSGNSLANREIKLRHFVNDT